jgi:hypothetical protein
MLHVINTHGDPIEGGVGGDAFKKCKYKSKHTS